MLTIISNWFTRQFFVAMEYCHIEGSLLALNGTISEIVMIYVFMVYTCNFRNKKLATLSVLAAMKSSTIKTNNDYVSFVGINNE